MRTDWYKGVDPNLERLTELLSISKPSHGYTIAEGGKPEIVTAPGIYFPATKGEVIPLESRQAGGNVNPTMNAGGMMDNMTNSNMGGGEDGKMKILASALKSIDKIVATFSPKESPMKLESRQGGGDVTSLLDRIGKDPNVFTETSSMGALNPEGDIQAGKNMDVLSNAMRASNLAILTPPPISLEQKEASMASSIPGLPSMPTSRSYEIQPEAMKLGGSDLIGQEQNEKRKKRIPLYSMAEGGVVAPAEEEDEYERMRRLLGLGESTPVSVGPERRFLGGKEVTSGPMYEASEKGMSGDELAKESLRSTLSTSDVGGEMKYWEDVAKARTGQAEYDRYAADKELREAAGISPRTGMPEYEATAARMRMTPGEKWASTVAEGELAKQYIAGKSALDVAQVKPRTPLAPHLVQNERGEYVWATPGSILPAGIMGKPTERSSTSTDLIRGDLRKRLGREPFEGEILDEEERRKLKAQMGGMEPLPAGTQNIITPTGGKNDAALEGLTEAQKGVVKGLADYDYPWPGAFALSKPVWQEIMGRLEKYDPSFSAREYLVRQKIRQSYTSGKEKDNIIGLNTATGHIASLINAYKSLDPSSWSSVNFMNNVLASQVPVTEGLVRRQGKLTSVRTKFGAVTDEMAGIFKRTGATDTSIEAWRNTIKNPETATPETWKNFISGALELMGSRIKTLRDVYESGMGKPADFPILSTASREILKGQGVDTDAIDPLVGGSELSKSPSTAGTWEELKKEGDGNMADIRLIAGDPEFKKLPFEEQIKAFIQNDPEFASLPEPEQMKGVQDVISTVFPQATQYQKPLWQLGIEAPIRALEGAGKIIKGGVTAGIHPFRTAANVGQSLGTFLRGPLELLAGEPVDPEALSALRSIGEPVTKAVTEAVKTPLGVPEKLLRFGLEHPTETALIAAPGLGKAGEVLSRIGLSTIGKIATTTGKVISPITPIEKVVGKTIGMFKSPTLEQAVETGMKKGTRYAFGGKATRRMEEGFLKDSNDAVRSIISNKPSLEFSTPSGEVVKGKLPITVAEFDQTITQGLQNTFTKSNTLTKLAEAKGGMVKPTGLVQELRTLASKSFVQDTRKPLANAASELADSIEARIKKGGYTPLETEQEIAALNNELHSYYNTPGFKDEAMMRLKAAQANHLRRDLDSVVSKLTGTEYQPLKNEYHALRSIQDDVHKKSIVEARRPNKGFFDLGNIFSWYHIFYGAMTGGGSQVVAGLGTRALATWYKWMNSPNRAVNRMFEQAEKAMAKGGEKAKYFNVSEIQRRQGKTPFGEVVPSGPAIEWKPEMGPVPSVPPTPNLPMPFVLREPGGLPVPTGEMFGVEAVRQPRLEWWRGPGAKGVREMPTPTTQALPSPVGFTSRKPGFTPTRPIESLKETYGPSEIGPGVTPITTYRRTPLPFMQPTELPTPIETRGILSRSVVRPTAPIPTTLRSKMGEVSQVSPEEYAKHISMAKDAIFKGVPIKKVADMFRTLTGMEFPQ